MRDEFAPSSDAVQSSAAVQASAASRVPAAPVVMPDAIWMGTPNVLVDGGNYAIGWQGWPEDKGGPGFVIARRGALGTLKAVDRYPMTNSGWARAWQALTKLDPATAEKVRPLLARRAELDRSLAERKALDARSIARLANAVFIGGYLPGPELVKGHAFELRFLEDRLSVFPQDSPTALVEFSYVDVQAIEIAGPGLVKRWSAGQQAIIAEAFGLTGALFAYGSTRIKTFVRVETADSELFFLYTALLPDDLRIQLSRGLGAIRAARASAAPGDHRPPASGSLIDELSRLAGLLEGGLLTREEFDELKARVIAAH